MTTQAPIAPRPDGATRRRQVARWVPGVVVGLIGVAALPALAGSHWSALGSSLGAVSVPALVFLAALWIGGLALHTITLSAALPGLRRPRALLLSLTGSAVSNVLPLGGAAGIALNYRMTRTWGFSRSQFASYTVVTNVCDVVMKLVLPALLLPLLWLGMPIPAGTGRIIEMAALLLPVVVGLALALLLSPWAVDRFGGRVEQVRRHAAGVLVGSWRRLGGGMVLYTATLLVLLASCLAAVGAGVPAPIVVLAFTAERLATLVNLTPGGLGVVEAGLAGVLALAPGADPAGVAAGVLLYRAFTFGLEIPVGGALLAVWVWRRRGAR